MAETTTTLRPEAFFRPHIERWHAEGRSALIFENAELGHPLGGTQVAMPADSATAKRMRARLAAREHTTAPDGPHGPGWRYVLRRVIGPGEAVEYQPEPERQTVNDDTVEAFDMVEGEDYDEEDLE